MSDAPILRRSFMKNSTVLAAAAAAFPAGVQSQNTDTEKVRVALIGCGGRGTGAAAQALSADDKTEMWAMADIDQKQIDISRETLEKNAPDPKQVKVSRERQFTGLEGYRQVMAMDDVDVVRS